jgi:hypothetical protein
LNKGSAFIFKQQGVEEEFFSDTLIVKMKALHFCAISETVNPATQHHFPED